MEENGYPDFAAHKAQHQKNDGKIKEMVTTTSRMMSRQSLNYLISQELAGESYQRLRPGNTVDS